MATSSEDLAYLRAIFATKVTSVLEVIQKYPAKVANMVFRPNNTLQKAVKTVKLAYFVKEQHIGKAARLENIANVQMLGRDVNAIGARKVNMGMK